MQIAYGGILEYARSCLLVFAQGNNACGVCLYADARDKVHMTHLLCNVISNWYVFMSETKTDVLAMSTCVKIYCFESKCKLETELLQLVIINS